MRKHEYHGHTGPGPHSHPDDHVYYVLTGTVSLFLDGEWTDASRGCYALIPGGTQHNFENRSAAECGFISFNVPGDFEEEMPAIVEWFVKNPLQEIHSE